MSPAVCSIKRNICYGLEEEDGLSPEECPTDEQIQEAARLANAHDFIMAMPQGYDSVSIGADLTGRLGTSQARGNLILHVIDAGCG